METIVPTYAPTLASAQAFHQSQRLDEWAQAFLRGEGTNLPFADGLRRRPRLYLLAEVDLDACWPCCGPAPDFDYPVPPEKYEAKVQAMASAVADGWDVPPLFVHLPTWYLCDGTHRREALLRSGRSRHWAVLWQDRPPLVGRGQPWPPRDDEA